MEARQGSQLRVPRPEWVWYQLQTCEGLLWGCEGRHELRTWEAEPGELSGNQYHFSLKKIFLHGKLATLICHTGRQYSHT